MYGKDDESDDDVDDEGPKKKKGPPKPAPGAGRMKRTKECPGCGSHVTTNTKECPSCDYIFTSKSMLVSLQTATEESIAIRDRFPFEPEREEDGSLNVEKILGRRPRKTPRRWVVRSEAAQSLSLADMSAMDGKYDHDYLVKVRNFAYMHACGGRAPRPPPHMLSPLPLRARSLRHGQYKGMSYLHVQWLPAAEIEAMNVKAKQTLNRYLSKLDRGDPGTPEVPRHSHGSTHAACPHIAPSPTTAPLAGRTASWTRRGPSWSAFWTCVRRR
jgi:hypothetical protein